MSEHIKIPVLPMRGAVVFPGPTVPVAVSRAGTSRAVDEALSGDRTVFVVAQRENTEAVSKDNLYSMGVIAKIGPIQRGINGIQLLITGETRAVALDFETDNDIIRARVMPVKAMAPVRPEDPSFAALYKELRQRAVEFGKQRGLTEEVLENVLDSIQDPGQLADLVASQLDLSVADRQLLLETLSVEERMRRALVHLQREIDMNRTQKLIQKQVNEELQGRQREMYLREQLKAIQRELGSDDDDNDLKELKAKLNALDLPKEAREEADRELGRLERAGPQSTEAQVIRTYLQWLVELPWNVRSKETFDLPRAEQILEDDHFGLGDVKDRVLEFLSVRHLQERQARAAREAEATAASEPAAGADPASTASGAVDDAPETKLDPKPKAGDAGEREAATASKAPILLFTGPPGVGKTSIAKSIARALNREYVRIALGGARDEADIRGHRRTYVGAMPGRLIQGLKRAGTKNPVVLLDEVDKLGASLQGDPSSALLEVLDPAQNGTFTDHYLNVPFDLSEVLFIATANVTHAIPAPLLDRMEVVEFSGYTEREKLEIAKRYLVPRQLAESGLSHIDPQPRFEDEALSLLISGYTRESGVRKLENQISAITRKLARGYASEQGPDPVVSPARVESLLGRPKVHPERIADRDEVGVATGMYYTPMGGDIMFVEAALRPLGSSPRVKDDDASNAKEVHGYGSVSLILTGQLGDVMRESARAALTYATSHAFRLQIPRNQVGPSEVHVHVPAGAIPKDGPSAGTTIATALVSAMSGRPVRRDLAMTGEITLTGRVLPIGGVKEKVLGAHRAGVRHVVLPRRNAADLEDVPREVRDTLQFHFADTLDDVLRVALLDGPNSEQWPTPPLGERSPASKPLGLVDGYA